MEVYVLCNLYINEDDDIEIWDSKTETTVFSGTISEVSDTDLEYEDVASFGIENGKLVIII